MRYTSEILRFESISHHILQEEKGYLKGLEAIRATNANAREAVTIGLKEGSSISEIVLVTSMKGY